MHNASYTHVSRCYLLYIVSSIRTESIGWLTTYILQNEALIAKNTKILGSQIQIRTYLTMCHTQNEALVIWKQSETTADIKYQPVPTFLPFDIECPCRMLVFFVFLSFFFGFYFGFCFTYFPFNPWFCPTCKLNWPGSGRCHFFILF